jgi:hypothetical protein
VPFPDAAVIRCTGYAFVLPVQFRRIGFAFAADFLDGRIRFVLLFSGE